MEKNQDLFNVLRSIDNNNNKRLRYLAKTVGFSLGKFNYCLKELKERLD